MKAESRAVRPGNDREGRWKKTTEWLPPGKEVDTGYSKKQAAF